MLIQELLLKILEDLLKEDFKTFKWYLTLDLLENCNPIPRAHLQDASRIETVDKLLRSYSEETAVKITNEALRRMNMTKASEELMSAYAPERSTPSSSSGGAPRPMMTAEGGSTIIAPTISVAGNACNITIGK
ncbi:uncharacterized protein [Takifugu rubripes]|uniref:uncharacterized protein n=1 Tax=Takifugu rubripes TaxID=31033 RepID=UPI0011458DB1|nr:uncharacterized protein LOC115253293 [Takifugu rubripes]